MARLGAVWLTATMIALAPGAVWAGDDVADFNAAYAGFKELVAAGEAEAAIPFAEKALDLGGKLNGPDSREAGILTLNLGNLYTTVGEFDQASDVLSRSVTIYEKIYGKKARELIRPLNQLGHAARGRQDFDAAKQAFRRALLIAEKSVGPNELVTAEILLNLGQTDYLSGERQNAEQNLAEAIRIYEKRSATAEPGYGSALLAVAKLRLVQRKRLEYQLRGLSVLEAALPPNHNDVLVAHAAIIATYENIGRRRQATRHVLYLARHQGEMEGDVRPLYRVAPVYPRGAARTGKEGYVDIDFTIGVDGMVRNASVIGGKNVSIFRRAALECLDKWRYKPRIVYGDPIEQNGKQVRIMFTLKD